MLTATWLPQDTISGFKGVLDGKYDDLPEMVRTLPACLPHHQPACLVLNLCMLHRPSTWWATSRRCQRRCPSPLALLLPMLLLVLHAEHGPEMQADKMARDMASSN